MGAGEVLESGPDRPARGRLAARLSALRVLAGRLPGGGALRRGLARLPRGSAARRGLGALLVVLAAAGLALLRSGAGPVAAPEVAAVPPAPLPVPVPAEPGPPYDGLPGRSPIPPPTHAGWFVRGTLPAVGGPDRAAAERSTQLVLGRFCRRPDRYTITFDRDGRWRRVAVFAFGLQRSGDGPAVRLELTWTGRSYDWVGAAVQLSSC